MEARSVSVVIPHYNHGRIIRRQLDAILRQTLKASEIIIVDDGSPPDKLAEVAEEISKISMARIVRKEKNEGAAHACNVGLAEAKSTYVCFLACDDEILPDLFRTATSLLDTHDQAAFFFSDPAVINSQSNQISTFPLYLSVGPAFFSPDQMERILSKNFFTFSTNTIIFRRAHLGDGMPAQMAHFADNFLDYSLALTNGAVYCPKVMGYFYEYADSYSSKRNLDSEAMRKLTASFLSVLEDSTPIEVYTRFQNAGILPEHTLRAIMWLLSTAQGRRYITNALIIRCLARAAWHAAMPIVPNRWRRLMRRIAAKSVRHSAS